MDFPENTLLQISIPPGSADADGEATVVIIEIDAEKPPGVFREHWEAAVVSFFCKRHGLTLGERCPVFEIRERRKAAGVE